MDVSNYSVWSVMLQDVLSGGETTFTRAQESGPQLTVSKGI